MKKRLFSILDTTKKRTGLTIFSVVLAVTLGTGIFISMNTPVESSTGTTPTTTVSGELEPVPYSMDDYLGFLSLEKETPRRLYSYDGQWVRSLYDENKEYGKPALFFSQLEDEEVLGWTPIYLKTVRNEKTNQIEKLVEMSAEEVFQLLHLDPDKIYVISMSLPK